MGDTRTNKRILIVDDEERVRETFKRVLSGEGYTVFDASDGDDALLQMAQTDFQLVLLDIRMPGLNGWDVLDNIRRDYPETKVIIVSGIEEELERDLKGAVFAYLTKPCSMSRLKQTVEQAIGASEPGPVMKPHIHPPVEQPPDETRILVVDDEDNIRNNLCRALTGEGYKVTGASCAEEALSTAAREKFTLALLDVRMPGMSGLELLPELKSIQPDIKIIMLTGMGDRETVQAALVGNASDFLVKPCTLVRLTESVEKVLKQNNPTGHSIAKKYSRGKSVLVVDDETGVRKNICRALEMEDYDVVGASDGEDALEKLSQEKFNVVLLDINMPGMSGTEVLHHIKAKYPETLVIMLTALVERDGRTQSECIGEGAFAYLQKPCKLELVVETVEKAFQQEAEYWGQLPESDVSEEDELIEEQVWKKIDEPSHIEKKIPG